MSEQNVLTLDIETSYMLVYIWDLGEQHIGVDQIYRDWNVIAWAAKWLNSPKVIYRDLRKGNFDDDRAILKDLWELINKADIIVTQNGKKFDMRKLNARFMIHKMKPPKPYLQFDTYRVTKNVAEFTSHKLSYLTEKLCPSHQKDPHTKFPGRELWKQCLLGNMAAWKEMEKYNIKDVLSTEELYNEVRPWAPDSAPKIFPLTADVERCATCGYVGPMRAGRDRIRKSGVYVQNSCAKCGAWQAAKKKVGK